MEIKFTHGNEMVVKLIGRLDTVTSTQLADAFAKEKVDEPMVIIDASELEYISSAGLRLLISLKKELADKNKTLEIHSLNDVCTEVFKVTGFINVLTVK